VSIGGFFGLEVLGDFLPAIPDSTLERWLVVALDHPLRCGLALGFLWRALLPPRRDPT
jgi:hypothetical protein